MVMMTRSLRIACIAVLLVVAGVIFAPQAFATLRLTTSTGTAAVTPFLHPIGSSGEDNQLGVDINPRLSLAGFEVTCSVGGFFSYAGETHTQLRVFDFDFGSGLGGSCRTTGGGRVDGDRWTTPVSTVSPWHIHFRTHNSVTRSATGTLNNSSAMTFVVTSLGASCEFTIPVQSIDMTYTYGNTSLMVSDATVVTNVRPVRRGDVCPASGNATLSMPFTLNFPTLSPRLLVRNTS
jgi:hypothetical protein